MAKASVSPLRYPGGKSSLLDLIAGVIHNNELRYYHYAEPYAGGGGLALALLYGGYVSEIHLNDIDLAIWSFWFSVLNNTDEFIKLIEQTPVSFAEWERQREIFLIKPLADPLLLGFATFFLNRTNRSGIIKGAGAIGGRKQTGNYKIDCRFNKEDLINKILRIGKYRDRINLYNQDAIAFMNNSEKVLPHTTLFFIDPPYYNQGASLYTSFYKPEHHMQVSSAIKNLKTPWMVTYDNVKEISSLYLDHNQYQFNIRELYT